AGDEDPHGPPVLTRRPTSARGRPGRNEPLRIDPGGAPVPPCRWRSGSDVRGARRRRLPDLPGRDAPRADPHAPALAVRVEDLHRLQVRQPPPPRLVVRVADVVPGAGRLAARVAHSCHEIQPWLKAGGPACVTT